ncbi:MAG: HAD family hydrolase [Bacteroidales bacterium]|nr:HAD family hydrolase [Bacteroidales bacterium]MBD5216076.1 HAD family hydrolase [Bacteroidales bacterium]MBD5220023.1 HAD family hydrolase [Bacteroidales bacterium]MDE6437253.1 HAD family hydrolase [Muribaculaceae bacterium]
MKSLVIFDLDGTLLNTIDDLAAATNHAMSTLGYPVHGLWVYPNMVGNGVAKLIERALPDDARSESTIQKALGIFKEYYNEHCCDATQPYPGITEMLQDLTARGVSLAVTSNKYEEGVTKLIHHYFPDANFKAILGSVEGMPRKPDPSIVFKALSMCPTPKSEVLYVGDSGVDMETARRACIESVGVTWGFRPIHELKEAYADHILSTPTQIISLVTGEE